MREFVETIIIGGGQAGLAMSYYLCQHQREHIVFERGRIAERWRSERWDSLVFQFPNWMMRLPGHAYAGTDPDGFTEREGVVRFISQYATHFSPPMRCGTGVTRLSATDSGRLLVQAGQLTMEAANVVVATGPYQLPLIPPWSAALPHRTHQISANRYTCPADLPVGSVLVVGSGGSGVQIVEDLVQDGRHVYFSLRRHRLVPRRYRGHDVGWWFEETGMLDRTVENIPPGWRAPLLTGVGGGRTIRIRDLPKQGVTLLGSLLDIRDRHLFFSADLNENLAAGDATFQQFIESTDAYVDKHGIEVGPRGEFESEMLARAARLPEMEQLDIGSANINTVIWATGYRPDFGWIECPVFNEHGMPVHRRGLTDVCGLSFLGLPRMHKVKSAFLWGVGEDAEYLAHRIVRQ